MHYILPLAVFLVSCVYSKPPPVAPYNFTLCYDKQEKKVHLNAIVPSGQWFAVGFGKGMS
jgi:hypothetical protein